MMTTRWHKWLILFICLIVSVPVFAQFDDTGITLATFTNTNFHMRGMRPQNWNEHYPNSGVYVRERDALDRTALLVQSSSGTENQILNNILAQYDLSTALSVLDSVTTASFSWSIYRFQSDIGDHTLWVDLALSEQNGLVYMVLMQTNELFYMQLHQSVFLAVLNTIAPIDSVTSAEAVIAANRDEAPASAIWIPATRNGFQAWQSTDESVVIYVGTLEMDDGEAAINDIIKQILPDEDLSYDRDNVTIIENGDSVIVIIDYPQADGVVRGMAQVTGGIAYVSILDSTDEAIQRYHIDIEILTGDAMIDGLVHEESSTVTEPQAELTSDVTPDVEVTPEAIENAGG